MPDLAPWLPLLAIPFDAEVPSTPEADALDPAASRDRLHSTVETFLERILMMPTLLVIEDAHWLDDASRFLLRHLTAKPAPRPWLVCVTTRPGGEPTVAAATARAQRIELRAARRRRPPGARDRGRGAVRALGRGGRRRSRSARAATRCSSASSCSRRAHGERAREASRDGREPADDADRHARARPTGCCCATRPSSGRRSSSTCSARSSQTRSPRPATPRAGSGCASSSYAGDGDARLPPRPRPRDRVRGALVPAAPRDPRAGRRARSSGARATSRRDGRCSRSTSSRPATTSGPGATRCSAGERAEASFANVVAAELYERALAAARAPRRHRRRASVARVARGARRRLRALRRLRARARRAARRARELAAATPLARRAADRQAGERARALGPLRTTRSRRATQGSPGSTTRPKAPSATPCARRSSSRRRDPLPPDQLRGGDPPARGCGGARRARRRPRPLAHAYYLLDAAHTDLGQPDGLPYLELARADLRGARRPARPRRRAQQPRHPCLLRGPLGRVGRALPGEPGSEGAPATSSARRSRSTTRRRSSPTRDASTRRSRCSTRCCASPAPRAARSASAPRSRTSARAAARAGRFDEAHALFDEALAVFEELSAERFYVEANARRAECLVFEGRYQEALEVATRVPRRGRQDAGGRPRGAHRADDRLRAPPGAAARGGAAALRGEPPHRPRAEGCSTRSR